MNFSQHCAVGTVLSLSADSGFFVRALASNCIGLEKHHLVSSQPLRNQQQKDVTLFKRAFFFFPRTLFVKHLFHFFFFWTNWTLWHSCSLKSPEASNSRKKIPRKNVVKGSKIISRSNLFGCLISNYWMRLSRLWRIMPQIEEDVIHRGWRPRWITFSEMCINNSSHPTKAKFTIVLLIIQNVSKFWTRLPPCRLFSNLWPISRHGFKTDVSPCRYLSKSR